MGLALASSAAAYINAGLLFRMLRRQGAYQPEQGWGRVLLAASVGGAAMVAVLAWQAVDPQQWAAWGATSRGIRLAYLIVLGAVVYSAATLAGGLRIGHLEKGSS
jgi:putative peptidoglycan lipid II flippase